MTTLRQAAQQALEALENSLYPQQKQLQAITTLRAALAESKQDWSMLEAAQESLREHMAEIHRLRAALAESEQEPVAKYSDIVSDGGLDPRNKFDTYSPQRKPLTEEEIRAIRDTYYRQMGPIEFARAIEQAHGIKGEA